MSIFERFPIWDLKVKRSTQLTPKQYGFEPNAWLILRRRIFAFIQAKNDQAAPGQERKFTVEFGPRGVGTTKEFKGEEVSMDKIEYITVKRIL